MGSWGVLLGGLLLAGCAMGGDGGTSAAPRTTAAGAVGSRGVPEPLAEATSPVERSRIRESAIETLIELTRSPTAVVRANALEGLALAPARLRPRAAAGLVDENEGVRAIAALLVGREGLGELAASVRPLVDDRSAYVRLSAIGSLRMLGEEIDPTPIADELLGHPSARVRSHAALVLGLLGDPSALPLLREAYRREPTRATPNETSILRLQIAESMIKLGDRSRLSGVRAALFPSRPEDLELTAMAVQVIGEVDDRASAGQVIQLSAYREGGRLMPAEVRLACASTAARLGHPEGGFIAEEYADSDRAILRVQAALASGWMTDARSLARCRRLMGDPDPQVRVAAAAAVLRMLGRGSNASSNRAG